jgi:hypothetical protein
MELIILLDICVIKSDYQIVKIVFLIWTWEKVKYNPLLKMLNITEANLGKELSLYMKQQLDNFIIPSKITENTWKSNNLSIRKMLDLPPFLLINIFKIHSVSTTESEKQN